MTYELSCIYKDLFVGLWVVREGQVVSELNVVAVPNLQP